MRRRKTPYTLSKLKRNQPRRFMISRTNPWPDTAYTKLVFNENNVLSLVGVSHSSASYSANSVFSPSGTVESAKGHSDWAAIYSKYRVYGCSVAVTFTNNGSIALTSGVGYINWLGPNENTDFSGASTSNDIQGSRNLAWKQVGVFSGRGSGELRSYRSIRSLARDSDVQDIDYNASVVASPIQTPTAQIGYATSHPSPGTLTVTMSVRVTYYVKYYQTVKGNQIQPV